jgi:aquaporin Z
VNKYAAEFIGTFFLVLTIGCAAVLGLAGDFAPVAIGSALMAMIYAGGHVSGAHFNPAVTFAIFLRGRCPAADVAPYIGVQMIASVIAALVTTRILGSGTDITALDLSGMTLNVFVVEFLFTFALGYVVLNTATAKGTDGNGFYGLAIGLTVVAGAFTVGGISGGAFNPAVVTGLIVMGKLAAANAWVHVVANLAGGAVAALAFKGINPDDK